MLARVKIIENIIAEWQGGIWSDDVAMRMIDDAAKGLGRAADVASAATETKKPSQGGL